MPEHALICRQVGKGQPDPVVPAPRYSPQVADALFAGGPGPSEIVIILLIVSVTFAMQALMIYGVFLIVRPLFQRLVRRRNDENQA